MRTFLEFFAGGGMARAGLGAGWRCLFANDIEAAKGAAYRANWGDADFRLADVADVRTADIPGARPADLAWASFPCQDLSLAGGRNGLAGGRSGAFWPFWRLIEALGAEGRAPRTIVLENVAGLLTSNGGADFAALGGAFQRAGFLFGATLIDARHFTPQSRPRLFLVAFRPDAAGRLGQGGVDPVWTPPALVRAVAQLPPAIRSAWRWLPLPAPPRRNTDLADLVEANPTGVEWHSAAETAAILALMAPTNLAKIEAEKLTGRRSVGTIFRRTRPHADGGTRQRAEARFDGLAGCLRTPAGGSSRQTLIVVEGETVRTRLLSPREAARLMGLADDYILPPRLNPALHLLGDGVAVPAVRFLAAHVLEPLCAELEPV